MPSTLTLERQLQLEVFKRAVKDHERHHCYGEGGYNERHCAGTHVPCEDAECYCKESDVWRLGLVPVGPETITLLSVEPTGEYDRNKYGHDLLVTVRYTEGSGHDHHALYGVSSETGDISLYAD